MELSAPVGKAKGWHGGSIENRDGVDLADFATQLHRK